MSTEFTQTTLTTNTLSSTPIGLSSRGAEMKSPTAFRTISEVATDLAVPQHVLRFWESKFQQIKPLKRGGGRRYYRPEDIQLIDSIKDLLYNQGFTIRGVQKLLKENGRFPSARSMVPDPQVPASMLAASAAAPIAQNATQSVVSTSAVPNIALSAQHQNILRGLSPEKRREVEGVLNELKALRTLLKQSGI